MIEKVKAEIERLKKNLPWGGSAAQLAMECNCKYEAYDEILRFIKSLEENQCNGCVNDKGCVTCVDGNMKETVESLEKKQPEGLDDVEETCKESLHIPETCKENANSFTDLGKAAEDSLDFYADNIVEWEDKNPQWDKDAIRATAYKFYTLGKEAGAKWMAEQEIVYEDKVYPTSYEHEPTEFCLDGGEEIRLLTEAVNNNILKQGDKVIVQIRKKEE